MIKAKKKAALSIALVGIAALGLSSCNIRSSDAFCDILSGKAPAVIIDKGEGLLVMAIEKQKTRAGIFRPHIDCLIICKEHVLALDIANPHHKQIKADMDIMVERLKKLMERPAQVNTVINLPGQGQTVPHLHMHVHASCNWKNPTWRTV